ncbi:pyruvate kinase [Thalassospiraceae bacterium LMO-JJ14]|nr:pyruvate kinase [Thalassospiraceae bacterium LMO-JJ14]
MDTHSPGREDGKSQVSRRTKIVATLGPSSSSPQMIEAIFKAGVEVFRLNFSHGSHDDHAERVAIIRDLEKSTGRLTCILADLQGPKFRIGNFMNGRAKLEPGASFRFDLSDAPGDTTRVQLPHPEILKVVQPGHHVLLDDGKVRVRIEEAGADYALGHVLVGGILSDHKGFNVPDTSVDVPALTAKDKIDLAFALSLGVDWIALSFVQSAQDVQQARLLVGDRAGIMVKLEKPSAVHDLAKILDVADAVMIARGDLGVEMSAEELPAIQKRIIMAARQMGKPVVVATQMLESMVNAPVPTRAETSDVANAVYDGTDAVMLSAESAAGQFPLEAVQTMARILKMAERDASGFAIDPLLLEDAAMRRAAVVTRAACASATVLQAVGLVTFTTSGSTTLCAARERVPLRLLSLSPRLETARRLVICYGVTSVSCPDAQSFGDMVDISCKMATSTGIAKPGDELAIIAGVPFGTPGTTNVMRVFVVPPAKESNRI